MDDCSLSDALLEDLRLNLIAYSLHNLCTTRTSSIFDFKTGFSTYLRRSYVLSSRLTLPYWITAPAHLRQYSWEVSQRSAMLLRSWCNRSVNRWWSSTTCCWLARVTIFASFHPPSLPTQILNISGTVRKGLGEGFERVSATSDILIQNVGRVLHRLRVMLGRTLISSAALFIKVSRTAEL